MGEMFLCGISKGTFEIPHQIPLGVPASATDNALLDSLSLVVLGLSVGCETMGVRHCLLLAGIIIRDGVA